MGARGVATITRTSPTRSTTTPPKPPPAAEDAATASPAADDAGAFHAREATPAPPNASRITVDGLLLVAPADRFFISALTGDLDGDGARDAAAVVQRVNVTGEVPDAGPDAGELVLYRGSGGRRALPAADDRVAAGAPVRSELCPAASPRADRAALARRRARGRLRPRRRRALGGGPRDHRRGDEGPLPRDAPRSPRRRRLTLDFDGADRDGDGLDDIAVRVSLDGGAPPFEPGPRVSAVVRWFDRPAGMSRDPDEPDASLRTLASWAATRAAKPKEAPAIPRYVEQVRSLYRALCAEGGSPRVVDVQGAHALPCGPSKGLEEADLAEVRAYAVTGDPLRAISALDRAQLAPATRTSTRTTDAQGWITQAAPLHAAPSVLRALGAVPHIERGRAPSWGALAFEPSGKLLVHTVAGVVRADPVQGDEGAADDVQPWRSGVVSPEGAYRWVEAYDACDAISLHATFAPNAGGDVRDVALPIAPPLGAKCDHAGARGEPATTLPIAWGPRGLEAIVAGEPLLFSPDFARATPSVAPLDQPVTLGAPRSPNGKVVAVATAMGILVRGAHARIFRAKELEGGYLELRDCAVSNDGARVACVRGGRAFVGVWDPGVASTTTTALQRCRGAVVHSTSVGSLVLCRHCTRASLHLTTTTPCAISVDSGTPARVTTARVGVSASHPPAIIRSIRRPPPMTSTRSSFSFSSAGPRSRPRVIGRSFSARLPAHVASALGSSNRG